MAHPQSSPRGLFAKNKVTTAGTIMFEDYSTSTDLLSADSTGLVVAGAVKISNAVTIAGNGTGQISVSAVAAKPSARQATKRWAFFKNSTGVTNLVINVTGTTWKYVSVTSVLITS